MRAALHARRARAAVLLGLLAAALAALPGCHRPEAQAGPSSGAAARPGQAGKVPAVIQDEFKHAPK